MSITSSPFYQGKQKVSLDFSTQKTSSAGGFLLLYKLMRKAKIINSFSKSIQEGRDPRYVDFSLEQLIQMRVLLLAMGYEDANDLSYLREDLVLLQLLPDGPR